MNSALLNQDLNHTMQIGLKCVQYLYCHVKEVTKTPCSSNVKHNLLPVLLNSSICTFWIDTC